MFKKILKTATLKQASVTLIGTLINGALGILFYAFLARILGPTDFGILTVAIATLTLIGDVSELGISSGLIKFIPPQLAGNPEQAFRYIKLSLEIKMLIWMSVLISGVILVPWTAVMIFQKPELTIPLYLSLIGVGGALLFSLGTSTLQAFQKFGSWSVVNITNNALRLLVVISLSLVGLLNIENALISYIVFPFFGFFLCSLLLPSRQIINVKKETTVFTQLIRFNSVIALFSIIAALSSRLDTLISARLLDIAQVGLYGVATQIAWVVPQLISALGVVSAPKFSNFPAKKEMLAYFKKLQLLVLGLACLILLSIPIIYLLIPIIYGAIYLPVFPTLVILLLAMTIFLLSVPLHTAIIYFYSRPDIFFKLAILNLLMTLFLGYYLISHFGIIGSATTVLVLNSINYIIPFIWFTRKNRT